MRGFGDATRVMAIPLIIGVVAAMAESAASAATRRAVHPHPHSRIYDGLWSVSIRTAVGPCDSSYRYPARIIGGRVTQVDSSLSYQISGAVVPNGAIAVTVSRSGHNATGYGRLRGASGGGIWSTDGNQCSGTWSAMRRASN